MAKLPDGFQWLPAKDLQRRQFFYYCKGGKRHLADAVDINRLCSIKIKSTLTDGRQHVQYVKLDKQVIIYSK